MKNLEEVSTMEAKKTNGEASKTVVKPKAEKTMKKSEFVRQRKVQVTSDQGVFEFTSYYDMLGIITRCWQSHFNFMTMIEIRIFVVLVMIPFHIIAQATTEPFKKANTILISTNMSTNDAFTNWGRHLAQNGYSIDKSDNNFYTFTTGPKDTSKFNYDFIINSSVTDSGMVIIKLKWRLKSSILAGTSETQFYDWNFAKGKSNVKGIIYNDLIIIIKSFGTYVITYEKR